VDANATGFDDPQSAGKRLVLQRDHDLSDELQSLEGRPGVPQDYDPRVLLRRVAEYLGETSSAVIMQRDSCLQAAAILLSDAPRRDCSASVATSCPAAKAGT
jgi:hypothetical protein